MSRYRADKMRTITESTGEPPPSTNVGALVSQWRNLSISATTHTCRSPHARSKCFIDPQAKLSSYGWRLSASVAPGGGLPAEGQTTPSLRIDQYLGKFRHDPRWVEREEPLPPASQAKAPIVTRLRGPTLFRWWTGLGPKTGPVPRDVDRFQGRQVFSTTRSWIHAPFAYLFCCIEDVRSVI